MGIVYREARYRIIGTLSPHFMDKGYYAYVLLSIIGDVWLCCCV